MFPANRTATLGVLALLAVLGVPSLVCADPITVGDGWHMFNWTGAPNVMNNDTPFTFSASQSVELKVTDAYIPGDRFEVYDFGVLVATTDNINGFYPFTTDPDVAYNSNGFSKGLFVLAAGNHSLTFKTVQIPHGYNSGTAFFRVDSFGVISETPEPATLALAALGLAGLGLHRLRRRTLAAS